jgi:hypothetical protein
MQVVRQEQKGDVDSDDPVTVGAIDLIVGIIKESLEVALRARPLRCYADVTSAR